MKLFGFIVASMVFISGVFAQECWTNTAGRAFHAELGGMTDTHVLFVMSDGSTNRLTLVALEPASQQKVRHIAGMPEIPKCMQATFRLCRSHLENIDNLFADGRMDAAQSSEARGKILLGFRAMYQKYKLPPEQYDVLQARLLAGK